MSAVSAPASESTQLFSHDYQMLYFFQMLLCQLISLRVIMIGLDRNARRMLAYEKPVLSRTKSTKRVRPSDSDSREGYKIMHLSDLSWSSHVSM